MEIKILEKPYTDEKLLFNEETGYYELTPAYVKSNFVMTFADDGVLVRRIRKNSRVIYNYLNIQSHTTNLGVVDFFLKRTEEGRKFLLEVLSEQMEADLETGYNDIGTQPAINFATGQIIAREELLRNRVCVAVEQLVLNNARYFGFNLITLAPLPPTLFGFVYNKTGGGL